LDRLVFVAAGSPFHFVFGNAIIEKYRPIGTLIIIIHHIFINNGTEWIPVFEHFNFNVCCIRIGDLSLAQYL